MATLNNIQNKIWTFTSVFLQQKQTTKQNKNILKNHFCTHFLNPWFGISYLHQCLLAAKCTHTKREYSPAPDSERPWPGKWSDCSTAQESSALCPGSAHIAHHTRAPRPHPDAERNGLAHMMEQKERFVKWPPQSPTSHMVSVDIKHPIIDLPNDPHSLWK